MEIRRWHYYVVINCALVYCVLAKPFSLNEVIAAESQQKQVAQTTLSPKLEASPSQRFSLNKSLRNLPFKSNKFKERGLSNVLKLNKKDSPFKHRKEFQIKSPLKPRRISNLLTRNKRKNLSKKREISGNEKLKQKYIPLLKNLGMLFDDILGGDASQSVEIERPRKRLRYYLEPLSSKEESCACSGTRTDSKSRLDSKEKAATVSENISEISVAAETSSETTDPPAPIHFRRFRQNKNIPLLLPRNTFSPRRNNNGLGKRNSTAHHRSTERNITRNNGISKLYTRNRKNEFRDESYEKNTISTSRDDAGRFRFARSRIRGDGNISRNETQGNATRESEVVSKTQNTVDDLRRNDDEHQRQNKLETGRNETESAELLPESVRRPRGSASEEDLISESIQSKESNEKSDHNDPFDIASNQRITSWSGSHTKENKTIGERNETVITKEFFTTRPSNQGPVVVIIDGYSVTRHKNGENKVSEKSIQIHSK